MDIHTITTSLGKSGCVTQRQLDNRPSVIYFHRRLDKDSAGNTVEILNTRFEKECPSPTEDRTRNVVNENVTGCLKVLSQSRMLSTGNALSLNNVELAKTKNIKLASTNKPCAGQHEQHRASQHKQDSSGHEENDCRKRHRTSFNNFQLKRLGEEFEADNYIIGMKRWRLSEELEIPEKQIKIWFQNRRTKLKKHILQKTVTLL